MQSSLDIVIVNWNSGTQLKVCLNSIVEGRGQGFQLSRVIIIDNNSTDRSVEDLGQVELPIVLIRNKANLGFGAACNQGLKRCRAGYVLFLNPDTVLFGDTLSNAITYMDKEKRQKVGICGIQLIDSKGRVAKTCARFPTPKMFFIKSAGFDKLFGKRFQSHVMHSWDHRQTNVVDHVIGAFYLVRRVVFDEIDGFDERFFVYLEDLDFSVRAYQAGWKTVYLATVQAFHRGGGTSEQAKAERLYYSLKSRILYGKKHFAKLPAVLLMLTVLCFEPLIRIAYWIWTGSPKKSKETLKGYRMLWEDVISLFRKP